MAQKKNARAESVLIRARLPAGNIAIGSPLAVASIWCSERSRRGKCQLSGSPLFGGILRERKSILQKIKTQASNKDTHSFQKVLVKARDFDAVARWQQSR